MSEHTSPFLMAISIGPVQEFIAASRKTRDLWHGSHLLSHISREVASAIHDPDGVELVFPAPGLLNDESASVANKLLIEIRRGDPKEIAKVAKSTATNSLRNVWSDWKLKSGVWPTITKYKLIDEDRLNRQLDGFLEVNAAWVPYNPDQQDADADNFYSNRRVQVEQLLAGRKSLRDFAKAPGDDAGLPKSSLDPARETVFIAESFRNLDENASKKVHRELRLRLNEQLDGVSLIKRLAGKNRLVSLSRVAVDPYIRAAESYGFDKELASLRGHAQKLHESTNLVERFDAAKGSNMYHYRAFPYDSQLFYADSANQAEASLLKETSDKKGFDDEVFRGMMTSGEYENLEGFFTHLQTIRDNIGSTPPTDVAVLVADGDRIGKALGEIHDAEAHRAVSQHLVDFATSVQEVVTNHFGAIIYTGGDDVLAFLPADTAIPCAWGLKNAFHDVMIKALPGFSPQDLPTLSVGVAIGHYSEHLQVLLNRGRDAERDAKKDRNALSVSYKSRSGGGTRTTRRRWTEHPVQNYWKPLVDGFNNDQIPHGFLYELDTLRLELQGFSDTPDSKFPSGFVASEVRRILDRKRIDAGRTRVGTDVQDHILAYLSSAGSGSDQLMQMSQLIDEMYISLKLAPTVKLASETASSCWVFANDKEQSPTNGDAAREEL